MVQVKKDTGDSVCLPAKLPLLHNQIKDHLKKKWTRKPIKLLDCTRKYVSYYVEQKLMVIDDDHDPDSIYRQSL